MEKFVQAVFDHFELVLGEDHFFRVDDETFIYLGDGGDKITLLCPCFPVPHEHHALLALLALNCQSDIIYGVADDTVVARLMVDPEASVIDMVNHFNAFIIDILSAKKVFGLG